MHPCLLFCYPAELSDTTYVIVIYATISSTRITYPQHIYLICFFVKTFQCYPAHLFLNIFAF
jgi:hypothetical protein